MSGCLISEAFEESVEDLLSADLTLVSGVVALGLQGGSELDGGHEEGAGFADGLEVAVHLDGACAVPVAEHPAVHLGAKLAHLRPLVVSGQGPGSAVERFDFRRY